MLTCTERHRDLRHLCVFGISNKQFGMAGQCWELSQSDVAARLKRKLRWIELGSVFICDSHPREFLNICPLLGYLLSTSCDKC